jgi:1-deoxy-D-xylulose-5-phosphate reductoisomerase
MNIYLLGATGSIGEQTLDIVRRNPGDFKVNTVAVNTSIEKLQSIIEEFNPAFCSVGLEEDMKLLEIKYPNTKFGFGLDGLIEAATFGQLDDDLVVNAVVGSVGLLPTYHAVIKGRDIALANKETLVIGGEIIIPLVKKHKVDLIPIDSEHSAIMQCLNGEKHKTIKEIIITASGGSFREISRNQLTDVSVKDALNHPNWSMGAKITIDSASMMNKGLEVIEAHYLFDVPYDKITTVLHKESIIHSMVEFDDTSIMAQIGNPDMRVPISYAINRRKRVDFGAKRLSIKDIGSLHFEPMNYERFPLIKMAYESGVQGGIMPAVLNAANEASVALFLQEKISFLQIEQIVLECIDKFENKDATLESILEADKTVKEYVYKKYQ